MPRPRLKSSIVPIRLNQRTVNYLKKQARKDKVKLGTYLRQRLEAEALSSAA